MLKHIYRLLEIPYIYDAVQKILGGDRLLEEIRRIISINIEGISYENALDVGCGTGYFSACFNSHYFGVDINHAYLKKAAGNDRRVFLISDAGSLPFKSEKFSLVFTLGVLHHLNGAARTEMLKEMWRVCNPGGYLLIIDGLIPSNRLNLLGYFLAKLDRGRFKMRLQNFTEMIDSFTLRKINSEWTLFKVFPHELVAVLIKK